ncbi:MAG: glycosyl transferase group 1 [Caulobacter sp.]|nr:glycosyl transferase group 1 [Caulobacter sp.]
MTPILHAMLGKGLGGLEQVFLDYQPILEAYAAARGAACVGAVRAGGKVAAQAAGRVPPFAALPAYTDWDPVSRGAARALVRRLAPSLVISHGQRPARLFQRVTSATTRLAVVLHKPVFDLEPSRTHYLCVGRHLAELAIARGARPERVHVIPNAVTPPSVLALPFARPDAPPRLVAAGRLHPKKGFDVLIAAVALLRDQGLDVGCEIAGEGDERGKLEAQIAALALGDRVRLVGWKSDVAAFLAGGDVFAFPSHQEGFPLTLLEAMAVGLPAAASAIPGPLEMIEDGVSGVLTPPGDPAALAAALAALIAAPAKAQALGRQARTTVLAEYGPERLAQRLGTALDAILARA